MVRAPFEFGMKFHTRSDTGVLLLHFSYHHSINNTLQLKNLSLQETIITAHSDQEYNLSTGQF